MTVPLDRLLQTERDKNSDRNNGKVEGDFGQGLDMALRRVDFHIRTEYCTRVAQPIRLRWPASEGTDNDWTRETSSNRESFLPQAVGEGVHIDFVGGRDA